MALACENGHLEAVKVLLEAKANVHERYGVTKTVDSWGKEVRAWKLRIRSPALWILVKSLDDFGCG